MNTLKTVPRFGIKTTGKNDGNTYKKIADQYTYIPRYLATYFIAHYERCAEKNRRHKRKARVIVKDLN